MLNRREAELEKSYLTQRTLLHRQATLEERQRLVRDMHDGIGGQLLGLLIQARRRDINPETIEVGLQQSMNDLRLIVDSMDSAEESIKSTLRSFEHRIRGQVEAAGVAFAVAYDMPDDTPAPGPSTTLQVLRILQEAVTNALRHARAQTIRLCCIQNPHGAITLTIADDGMGIDPALPKGRGLLNMQSRAAALGGTLEIASDRHGTRIELVLPALPGDQENREL
jgi:signal transduction histidine kinase